jgi:hypothetical protein
MPLARGLAKPRVLQNRVECGLREIESDVIHVPDSFPDIGVIELLAHQQSVCDLSPLLPPEYEQDSAPPAASRPNLLGL